MFWSLERESIAGIVKHPFRVALAAIMVVAAILRLNKFTTFPLWNDEAFTLSYVQEYSPVELIYAIPLEQPHLPLYYVVLDVWFLLTGIDVVSARILSILFSLGSVVVVADLARRYQGERFAIAVAAVLAVYPLSVEFSEDVRMYSLLPFLTILSVRELALALEHPGRRRRWRWALTAIALSVTHVYGWLVVAGEVLALFGELHEEENDLPRIRRWVGPTLAVGVVALPFAAVILAKISHPTAGGHPGQLSHTTPLSFDVVLFASNGLIVGKDAVTYLPAIPIAVGWVASYLVSKRDVRIALTVLVSVLTLATVLSLVKPILAPKYLTAIAPISAYVGGLGVAAIDRELALRGVLVLGVLFLLLGNSAVPTEQNRMDYREAVEFVDERAAPGDLVIGTITAPRGPFDRIAREELSVDVRGLEATRNPERLRAAVSGYDRVWIVFITLDNGDSRAVNETLSGWSGERVRTGRHYTIIRYTRPKTSSEGRHNKLNIAIP